MASTKGASKKRIEVGCRVEGNFGDLIPNSEPKKKRRRAVGFATVVLAAGPKNWVIRRDIDGEVKTVSSRSMKVVDDDCGVPLTDEAVTNANNEASNDENIHVSIVNVGFDISILTFYFF